MRYNKVGTHLKSRRLLPSRLRRATVSLWLGHARALTPHCGVIHSPRAASLPLGGRLLVSPILTQIGRENKFSAEIFVPIISPLRMKSEASVFLLSADFCNIFLRALGNRALIRHYERRYRRRFAKCASHLYAGKIASKKYRADAISRTNRRNHGRRNRGNKIALAARPEAVRTIRAAGNNKQLNVTELAEYHCKAIELARGE